MKGLSVARWSTGLPARSTGLTLTLVLAALLAQLLPASQAIADPAPARPIVSIDDGRLAGRIHDRADEFLGIPYAAAPVGNLRFRPPQQPPRWSGVRDAVHQAPACPQFSPYGLRDPRAVSEDCLDLDVYRPLDTRPGDRLPVLFWMHGGGYSQGTGTQFGGRTMADLTHTVVVSINYRLGQLGYLALPELTRENLLGSGSYGLMDQIAALQWTRANIAAFGGNPANITISGQSAGAASVCAMLAAPRTAGLFTRAVLQSGPCTLIAAPSSAQAAEAGRDYATAAGCPNSATRAVCLRDASLTDLIAAARARPTSGPAYGDRLLPAQPSDAIAAGAWNKVPVVIGSTRAESRFFVALTQPYLTAEEYVEGINAMYGPAGPQVLARYPLSDYPSAYLAMSAVSTDSTFACHTLESARVFAAQVPTYVYEFDDPNSPTLYGAQVPGVDMANAHSAELAYLHDFTMSDRPLTPIQVTLANRMKSHWAAFARTGNPNTPGQAHWPKLGPRYTVLALKPQGDHISTGFADEHHCAFWTLVTSQGSPLAGGPSPSSW
jgi:para-nitrobenzyl esterase